MTRLRVGALRDCLGNVIGYVRRTRAGKWTIERWGTTMATPTEKYEWWSKTMRSGKRRWFWRLVGANGEIVSSGQSTGYTTKKGAMGGIEANRRLGQTERVEPAKRTA